MRVKVMELEKAKVIAEGPYKREIRKRLAEE